MCCAFNEQTMECISINIIFDIDEVITENENLQAVLEQFDRYTLHEITAIKWCYNADRTQYVRVLPIPFWLRENAFILSKNECIRTYITYSNTAIALGVRFRPPEE